MSFGIVGAHRVGKSTLAELLSNETDCGLLQTNVGSVFKDLGIDPSEPMPFGIRLMVQDKILSKCQQMWEAETEPFFTDRTPICMLAYTTADLASNICLTDIEYEAYMGYRRKCFAATHRFFGQLFVIQPGIPLVDPGDKPTASMDMGFIEHINTLVNGIAYSPECYTPVYVMPRWITDLNMRKVEVLAAIQHAYKVQDEQMLGRTSH